MRCRYRGTAPTLGDVARGDGRLTHDLLPDEKGPQDECGVFGVWTRGGEPAEAAKLTYFGLYALQHRGQEAAGIAVSDGAQRRRVQGPRPGLAGLRRVHPGDACTGHLAIGHTRYSTTGASNWENAQPTFRTTQAGTGLALAHNGNLVNTAELRELAAARTGRASASSRRPPTPTSSPACWPPAPTSRSSRPRMEVLPTLRGAFCLVFMDEHTLYAARDPQGVHPLVLGRLERGWVVASETAALDIVGASFVREVEPGELIADRRGRPAQPALRHAPNPRAACSSTSTSPAPTPRSPVATSTRRGSRSVVDWPARRRSRPTWSSRCRSRARPGRSVTPRRRGIPYGTGLVKNSYVGRTFIQPSQTIRQLGIRLKLNPLRDVIRGKRLVVVDDSIVRGNTQRALVRMLREAGRARGARPHLQPAGEVAVLLRHRLRLPGRAHRERPGDRRDPRVDRRGLARLRVGRGAHRRQRAAAQPAVPRLLRRALPDPAVRPRRPAPTSSRASTDGSGRGGRRDGPGRAAGRDGLDGPGSATPSSSPSCERGPRAPTPSRTPTRASTSPPGTGRSTS